MVAAGSMPGEGVWGYLFVDAGSPTPWPSWMVTVPPDLAAQLREMADPWLAAAVVALVERRRTAHASPRSGCPAVFRNRVSLTVASHVRGSSSAHARVAKRSRWLSPAQRGTRRRGGQGTRTRLAGETAAEPPPRAADRARPSRP